MAMTYGTIYVASVAMGAKDEHTLKAFLEAEAYDGPALIIAYSHCIAHGINMTTAMQNQKAAVNSAQWLLYRYNPERAAARRESACNSIRPRRACKVSDYFKLENRFKMLDQDRSCRGDAINRARAGGRERAPRHSMNFSPPETPTPTTKP